MRVAEPPLNAAGYERRAATALDRGTYDWFAGGAGD